MARKLQPPPSSVTGPLGAWLRDVHQLLESTPNFSLVSFNATDTPNSRVTGMSGDFVVNIGSAVTDARLWLLGGGVRSSVTDQGWKAVSITP
jgi:hypothetical protein